MADEVFTVNLPQSFYDSLKEVKEEVASIADDQKVDSKRKARLENVQNADTPAQKFVPTFKPTDAIIWRKIGFEFFTGGVEKLFKELRKIKQDEEYRKVKDDVSPAGQTVINNYNAQKDNNDKEPDTRSWVERIFSAIAGSILLAGLAFANHPLGQVVEGLAYLPNLLSGNKLLKKQLDIVLKFTKKLAAPFKSLGKISAYLERAIAPLGKAVSTIAKGTNFLTNATNLGKIAGKFAVALAAKLRFLPFIGSLIGFWQSALKYGKGDIVGGTLELASALFGMVPLPIFSGIAIGLSVIEGLVDSGIGNQSLAHGFLISAAKIGPRFLKNLTGPALKWLGFGLKALKFIPFFGALIGLYNAYENFQKGNYVNAVLDMASAVAGCFPGIGTAIAIGLDIVNSFAIGDNANADVMAWGVNAAGAAASFLKILSTTAAKILKPFSTVLKRLPLFGTILNFAEAYNNFNNGNIVKGILNIAAGIASYFPGIGTAISIGLDIITGLTENDTTAGEAGHAFLTAASGAAKLIIKKLPSFAAKLLTPLKFVIKKVPLLGTVISFADAYLNFKDGNYIKGILDIAAGIAGIFPGIGTAIAIGLDVINMFIDGSEDSEEEGGQTGETPTKLNFTEMVRNWAESTFGMNARNIPFIAPFIRLSDAYTNFSNGNILAGIHDTVTALISICPGVGNLVAVGFDFFYSWLSSEEEPTEAKTETSGVGEALKNGKQGLFAQLSGVIKNVPILGSLLKFGDAWTEFSNGNIRGGLHKIIEAISSSLPGLGGALMSGLSLIEYFLDNDEPEEPAAKAMEYTAFKEVISGLTDLTNLENFGKKILEKAKNKALELVKSIGSICSDISDWVCGLFGGDDDDENEEESRNEQKLAALDSVDSAKKAKASLEKKKPAEHDKLIPSESKGHTTYVSIEPVDLTLDQPDTIEPVSEISKKPDITAQSIEKAQKALDISAKPEELDIEPEVEIEGVKPVMENIETKHKQVLNTFDLISNENEAVWKKHKIEVSNILTSNKSEIVSLGDKLDILIQTVRDKEFMADASTRVVNINNGNTGSHTMLKNPDRRMGYKNLGINA